MQLTVLMFFQRLSSTFLDLVAEFFTVFGEALLPLAILLAIYWCSSKKRGFVLFSTLLCSLMTINIIKPIVRSERPFIKYPQIKGKRVSTATGFSFPSGHTVTAATFYPSLALGKVKHKKRFLALAIVLSTLVGISRLYLGVHWPIDVIAGLAIGYLFTFLLTPVFERLHDGTGAELFALITGTAAGVLAVILMIILQLNGEFDTHFSDLMKMSCLAAGGMLGFFWDRRKINFSTSGSIGKKVVRYLIGILGLLVITGIKFITPESLYYIGAVIRYTLIGLWATALFPLLAIKLDLMHNEDL